MARAANSAANNGPSARAMGDAERSCEPIGAAALGGAVSRLADRLGDVPLALGAFGRDVTSLAMLVHKDDTTLTGWLARESRFQEGMDKKAQGAFLIGRLTSGLVEPLACLFLADRIVPCGDADTVGLAFADNGEGGLRCTLHIDQGRAWLGHERDYRDLRERLRLLVVDLLGPVVDRLRTETGLSIGAYWRLVADTLAYKFLGAGSRLGIEVHARSEALALIGATGSPLSNGKTGYVEIEQPMADATATSPATKWFITRGGCCRYYTCEGGEICSVCVLREPEDRDALLRAHLVRLQAAAS